MSRMYENARVAASTSGCFLNASTLLTNDASSGGAASARATGAGGPFAQTNVGGSFSGS